MESGNIAWMLVASAMVLLMTLPALILFYAGMVRAKNVLSIFVQCYVVACLMSVLWYVVGYSIAYGGANPYWGGLSKVFLLEVTRESVVGELPEILFFVFQMTFAIVTPVIIIGAFAERVKFGFVIVFSALWMLMVYAPVAHWVWGGGFLSDGGIFGAIGTKDFAGGIVVHQTAGITGLILAIVIGPRLVTHHGGHSPVMTLAGAGLLWVGWYGFNGGSQLQADANAAMAVFLTHIAAATATLTWIGWEILKTGRFTVIGMVTGSIAGLPVITPASGYVGPLYAVMIGAVAAIIAQEAVGLIKSKLRIDDALDVFAVHGVAGMFGSMMLAPLRAATWTSQLGGMAIVGGYTLVVTIFIIFFCKGLVGMRVTKEEEEQGLDLSSHHQPAYSEN